VVSQRHELSELGGAEAPQQLERLRSVYDGQELLSRELLGEFELGLLDAQHSV